MNILMNIPKKWANMPEYAPQKSLPYKVNIPFSPLTQAAMFKKLLEEIVCKYCGKTVAKGEKRITDMHTKWCGLLAFYSTAMLCLPSPFSHSKHYHEAHKPTRSSTRTRRTLGFSTLNEDAMQFSAQTHTFFAPRPRVHAGLSIPILWGAHIWFLHILQTEQPLCQCMPLPACAMVMGFIWSLLVMMQKYLHNHPLHQHHIWDLPQLILMRTATRATEAHSLSTTCLASSWTILLQGGCVAHLVPTLQS